MPVKFCQMIVRFVFFLGYLITTVKLISPLLLVFCKKEPEFSLPILDSKVFCCLKMKLIENILRYLWGKCFEAFERQIVIKYLKMFKKDGAAIFEVIEIKGGRCAKKFLSALFWNVNTNIPFIYIPSMGGICK